MAKRKDLTGQMYGALYVEGVSDVLDHQGVPKWKCLCDCGNITYVRTGDLRSGHTKSCGCKRINREKGRVFFKPKEDCRAYLGDKCAGLKEMLCKTRGECKFYKPKEKGEV